MFLLFYYCILKMYEAFIIIIINFIYSKKKILIFITSFHITIHLILTSIDVKNMFHFITKYM